MHIGFWARLYVTGMWWIEMLSRESMRCQALCGEVKGLWDGA